MEFSRQAFTVRSHKMASTSAAQSTGGIQDGTKKMSRENWKKQKELEEARKLGNAPAEVDEEGRDINPHIPQYISQAPWYISTGRPTLKHQRVQDEKAKVVNSISDWYQRGQVTKKSATKFRKGACENCGAMTHKKKDCLERPRKTGAKYTGSDIKPDEAVQPDLVFDYDGKRDRWNGYNPDWYQEKIDEYRKVEEAKRQLKAERLEKELISGEVTEAPKTDSDSDEDEDKYADSANMPGTKYDSKTRSTVRNLRIREDTAKYLVNLGPDAPYYDPKTHSMRENPYQDKESSEVPFAGDNFVRFTGDVKKFSQQQLFAWEAYEHGTDLHPNVDPTKLELMYQEFQDKKENFKTDQQKGILEKYGGEEHLSAPPKELLLAQTEHYVEYSRSGAVVKGQERAKVKSRYEEDVFINNHTTVWGSYWEDGRWGFACCHQFIKNAFCTGEAGKMAWQMNRVPLSSDRVGMVAHDEEEEAVMSLVEKHKEKLLNMTKKERRAYAKKLVGEEDESTMKEEKIQEAMVDLAEREREAEKILAMDERKRPYNSMKADSSRMPTEEEMEAFQMKRRREEDPMAAFLE